MKFLNPLKFSFLKCSLNLKQRRFSSYSSLQQERKESERKEEKEEEDVLQNIPLFFSLLKDQKVIDNQKMKILRRLSSISKRREGLQQILTQGIFTIQNLLGNNNENNNNQKRKENNNSILLQGEAALCLFNINSNNNKINSFDFHPSSSHQSPSHQSHYQPLVIILRESDCSKLLLPLIKKIQTFNDFWNDKETLQSCVLAAKAIYTILLDYPSLIETTLKLNIVEQLVPIIHPQVLNPYQFIEDHNTTSLINNITNILKLLFQSQHHQITQYCNPLIIEELLDTMKHILVHHATYCQNLVHQNELHCITCNNSRNNVIICFENLASNESICDMITNKEILRGMIEMYPLLTNKKIILQAILALSSSNNFGSILFQEKCYDLILGILLGGNATTRNTIFRELNHQLSNKKFSVVSPLLETIHTDLWTRVLTNHLENDESMMETKLNILECLINMLHLKVSFQNLFLSHGTITTILRLLKSSLNVVNFEDTKQEINQQDNTKNKYLLENIRANDTNVRFQRNCCLLLSILSIQSDAHGYLYICGCIELLLSIFINNELDFVMRKHTAITLANFTSNPFIYLHLQKLYSRESSFRSTIVNIIEELGEEGEQGEDGEKEYNPTDSLCLQNILKYEAVKRGDSMNIINYEVENNNIINALHSFLENEVFPWK